ncbi:OsmC family protein [Streptomyces sp. NK08204]|uniref:OsmC family protein n=1 Tax=Streptomyces sp. NK08204 TaxID=2873260 RepID=UPI001CEDE9C7|nr:OsmC family protein [Streptomyces sp. NK08204]
MTDIVSPTGRSVPVPEGVVRVGHLTGEAFVAEVRGHTLVTDQPVEAGGDDRGPTPVEVLVVSLAACVAHYAGRFLERHHLDREQLRVLADFTMADDRPARVACVHLRVVLPYELSRARLEGLRAVVEHCTVHNTLLRPPDIRLETGVPA